MLGRACKPREKASFTEFPEGNKEELVCGLSPCESMPGTSYKNSDLRKQTTSSVKTPGSLGYSGCEPGL